MVHPDLTTDPVKMQGHLGTIIHVLYEDCSAYVRFKNQMIGLYGTDALLMLVPPEIVEDRLRIDMPEIRLNASEISDIFNIYELHWNSTPEEREEALNWAMGNDRIAQAIVFSVNDWIEYQIDRLDRQQQPGRGT